MILAIVLVLAPLLLTVLALAIEGSSEDPRFAGDKLGYRS